MREYGLTILVAAAVTYLLTPLVRRFAIAVGAKHAARARDVHTDPVPLLGGIAMYLGLAAGLMVASRLTHLSTVFVGTRVGSGLLLAGGLVVLMGFVDDRWGLGAITKLAGQVGAGAILVWSGAVVAWLPVPGGGTLSLTPDQQTVLTILLVVVTINAVNFIDGLDGLAAGIVGIGAAAFFLYYYTLTKRLGLDEQTNPALASAILAGVCLGFLPHNFHPARIFMGDTGSMLLGLLLAYAPISSLASLDPNTLTNPSAYSGGTVNRFPEILPLLVPAIIMLIPYADLLLAVVRRTRAGQSPFSADKKHLQHRLLAIGHSHRASVLIMYLWASLFAGTVVLLSILRTKLLILGVVTLVGVLVLLLASMPRLRPWNRRGQLRLATDFAGPVPSAGTTPASPGPSGSPVASRVPAAAGVSAPGRGRADRGASLDRGLSGAREDRGLGTDPGLGADRGLGLDRPAGADRGLGQDRRAGADRHGPGGRPQGRADAGYGDSRRGDTGYENGWYGDPGREDVANRDAWHRDPGRQDVGNGDGRYGAGDPGEGRSGTGWDARPAPAAWEARPSDSARDGRPAEQARLAEAAWDPRPASAGWDAPPAATGRQTPPPAETGPAPRGLTAPSSGAPSSGAPSDGTSSNGAPSNGSPSNGSPSGGGLSGGDLSSGGPSGDVPSNGGWPPDPAERREPGEWYPGRADSGRPDPGQWYPGRPDPGRPDSDQWESGQWESGQWESGQRESGQRPARPHDAGPADAAPRDTSLYAAPPPEGGPQEAGPQDVRPQALDPLSSDPGPAQRPGAGGTRPVDRDGNDCSEDEESPLLPWRFL